MRAFLAGFHLVIGTAMFIVGVSVVKDSWKAPALILLAGSAFAITIGIGVLAKLRWVRWLSGLLLLVATIIAVFLLAGSIIWLESAGLIILLIYCLFVLVELITWRQVRLLTKE